MQFRLTATHYICETILPVGTLVGSGTDYPVTIPSIEMVGEDDAGKKAVDLRKKSFVGLDKVLDKKLEA